MKLNDFNKSLKEEYENNIELKQKKVSSKKLVFISLIPAFATALIVIAIITSLIVDQITVNNYNKKLDNYSYNFNYEYVDEMYKVNGTKEAEKIYNQNNPKKKKSFVDSLFSIFEGSVKGSNMDYDGSVLSPDISGETSAQNQYNTNVQEAEIDEADISKCDGTYIYYLYNDVYYKDSESTLKIYDLSGNVIAEKGLIFSNMDYNFYSIDSYYYGHYNGNSKLYLHDNKIIIETYSSIAIYEFDGNTLTFEDAFSFDGLLESRLFDNYYYFVGCKNRYYSISQFKESYYDGYSGYNCLYRLYKLNLDNNELEYVDLFDSYASTYYMNKDYFVIATSLRDYEGQAVTAIKIFDTDLNPLGVYRIKGNLNDNFAISIKDNYLRLVSTNVCTKKEKVNNLVIFDLKEGKRISIIEKGLGVGLETVRSVTFDGDKCFVVTFYTTDPLYEIDLSDPANPEIVDSYEAPGYSSYLKTFVINGDTYILGLGIIDGENKISLYKDEETNIQVGEDYIISDSRYNIFDDYHAFFFYVSEEENIIYFGTQRTGNIYTIFKIDVLTGDITDDIDVVTNWKESRCFLVNSKFYIPTSSKLEIINY